MGVTPSDESEQGANWAGGADFGALIRKQYDEYGRVIREANTKAE